MKLKTLAILTLLVLCCSFASAVTFGFGTAIGGSGLYCNYFQINYYGGALWAGIDNLSACGDGFATVDGFTATVPGHGKGVVLGDSIYAAYNGSPEDQWTVFLKMNADQTVKCNKVRNGVFVGQNGWVGVAAFSGFFVGTNQGPLSCTIPGKKGAASTKGVNARQKN